MSESISRDYENDQPALERHDKRTETRACDLISRREAIETLGEKPLAWTEGEYELGLQNQWQSDVDALKTLPSAQPEIAKNLSLYKCYITDEDGLQHEVIHTGDIRRVTGWEI